MSFLVANESLPVVDSVRLVLITFYHRSPLLVKHQFEESPMKRYPWSRFDPPPPIGLLWIALIIALFLILEHYR